MLDTTLNFSSQEWAQIEARDNALETRQLTTLLFNQKTYNQRAYTTLMRVLDLRRTWVVFVGEEEYKIYAPDQDMLKWYLSTVFQVGTEVEFKEEVVKYINYASWTVTR